MQPVSENTTPNLASSVDVSNFERLLTDISTKFINAAPESVDAEITAPLRSVVEFPARRTGQRSFTRRKPT